MSAHAILSASGAERWLKCPPSARLEQDFPQTSSAYAEEGREAHALAESFLKSYLAGVPTGLCTDGEKLEAVTTYVDIAIEKINEARARSKDAKILLEQRLDFSEYVPEGFGTGDLVLISDGICEVIDLKYGKGIPVSAVDNPQMRLYGLGAVDTYDVLYGFDTIRMTIVQPRLDSVSTEELSVDDLIAWGNIHVKPIALQAFDGGGEFVPGDHCRFCRAKVHCRARADANKELSRFDFQMPSLLSEDEIAQVLSVADRLQTWVSDLQTFALTQAVENGRQWPGYKLVSGRAVRKYLDADKVADKLMAAGYNEALIYERSLLGITAMEKVITKKKFGELLADLIITPPGKPALVPESDKRQAMDRSTQTRKDFEEEQTNG